MLTIGGTIAGWSPRSLPGTSLQSLLLGIVPADRVVLAGTTALMLSLAILPTALPATTAARTDPNALLRAE